MRAVLPIHVMHLAWVACSVYLVSESGSDPKTNQIFRSSSYNGSGSCQPYNLIYDMVTKGLAL